MGNLTKNFDQKEFVHSDNHPELAARIRITPLDEYKFYLLSLLILQPVRNYMECAMKITNGKRDEALNTAAGGVKTSEHLYGLYTGAVDFVFSVDSAVENGRLLMVAFDFIEKQLRGLFGQLILEFDPQDKYPLCIHVSLPTVEHRNECLVRKGDKKTFLTYKDWTFFK